MASRPKRKFLTSREKEILLQQFYDIIEENKEQFLRHAFVGDEDRDSKIAQSSDSDVQTDNNNEERSDIADDIENLIVIILSLESRKNCQENKSSRAQMKFLMKAIMLNYQRNQTLAFLTEMQEKL